MIPLRDTQPSSSFPFITLAIIAVNVMVFIHQITMPLPQWNAFIAHFGIVPDQLQAEDVVTSMFLHGGWLHLIGNMWFLWIFGDNIEDLLGHGKFLLFTRACPPLGQAEPLRA
jgi:membrane associated rhomboid family serine protease